MLLAPHTKRMDGLTRMSSRGEGVKGVLCLCDSIGVPLHVDTQFRRVHRRMRRHHRAASVVTSATETRQCWECYHPRISHWTQHLGEVDVSPRNSTSKIATDRAPTGNQELARSLPPGNMVSPMIPPTALVKGPKDAV
jgi:hypothetical protein